MIYKDGGVTDNAGRLYFFDEIYQFVEPERTIFLSFAAKHGDADAIVELAKKPYVKPITRFTKEYVAGWKKDPEFQQSIALQCVYDLIEHYYTGNDIFRCKNICDYLGYADFGELRRLRRNTDDILRVLDWMHEYSFGALAIQKQYEYFRAKIINAARLSSSESVSFHYFASGVNT